MEWGHGQPPPQSQAADVAFVRVTGRASRLALRANCAVDADCAAGTVCAVQADRWWSQCIACGAPFAQECKAWTDDFRAAAEAKCHQKCSGARAAVPVESA